MLKFTTLRELAGTAALALALVFTLPAIAQDAADAPATAEEATPPADDSAAQPADDAAPADTGGADAGTESSGEAAQPSGEQPEAPAEPAASESSAAGTTKADSLSLSAPVVASDGKQVGTVSRISASADGSIEQIEVNTGSDTVVVPGSAVSEGGDSVKLSISSDEVANLPKAGGGE